MKLIKTISYFTLLLCLAFKGFIADAQKYNFINFSVENGLPQSQVTCFTQDKFNELWIGTQGGLARFDGSDFINYDKSDGLPSNTIISLACDTQGNIWIGTTNGLVKYNGLSFRTISLSKSLKQTLVAKLVVDKQNNIWALEGSGKLYKITNDKVSLQPIDTVFDIATSLGDTITIASIQGIKYYTKGHWYNVKNTILPNEKIIGKLSYNRHTNSIWCTSNKGIFNIVNGSFKKVLLPFKSIKAKYTFNSSLFIADNGDAWLNLADGGVWHLHNNLWQHYTYRNGFTDESVNVFYEDNNGNIWIGTNGAGFYLFGNNFFTYYDRGSGLTSPSITSIIQSKNDHKIYFTSHNNELFSIDQKGALKSININNQKNNIISNLAQDSKGNIWIDVAGSGLYKFNGKSFSKYKGSLPPTFSTIPSMLYAYDNTIWRWDIINQLYQIEGNTITAIATPTRNINVLYALDSKRLLISSAFGGAFIYHKDTKQTDSFLSSINIICVLQDDTNIYIGTDDRGLIYKNKKSGKFFSISTTNGLSSNFIYNMLQDDNGSLWLGTGRGIDNVQFTNGKIRIKNYGKSDGLIGIESNSNVSLKSDDGMLWFGTTKGLYRFDPKAITEETKAPIVILQSLKLFSKPIPSSLSDSIIPFQNVPYNPQFAPGQNHLTFTFKGISLTNPDKIKYRYQLLGADKKYIETNQTTLVFSNLAPGDYILKIWASDINGNWYYNALSYPFTIRTPFYQANWFKALLLLLLVGILLLIVYIRNKQKERRLLWEQNLREEEQQRIRQRTAEDFHDEIGNKLTRINLLTTIAEKKLSTEDDNGLSQILGQIKQNVSALYTGSKDIIWSLQPQSDFLDEVLLKIRLSADNLFKDTVTQFIYKDENPNKYNLHQKLPSDFSRNIIMIAKEILNNAAKYAAAKNITLQVNISTDQLTFIFKDDGKGFGIDNITKGNGLKNIQNRADRIQATFDIHSELGSGTFMTLTTPFNPLNHNM